MDTIEFPHNKIVPETMSKYFLTVCVSSFKAGAVHWTDEHNKEYVNLALILDQKH